MLKVLSNISNITMGAGILPVTIMKGSIYFMLGLESIKDRGWCDFGGSSHAQESVYETAIREGYEELDGFLGNKYELDKLVSNNLVKQYYICRYTTFLFNVDSNYLSTMPYYFNNHRKYISSNIEYKEKDGIFEKTKIKLFSKKDLVRSYNDIRPFYREIVDQLLELEKNEILNK